MTDVKHETRESWLQAAVKECDRLLFVPEQLELPKVIRISTGLCGGKAIGLAFMPECAEDYSTNIFVDPKLNEPTLVLATVVHELCHAVCFAQGLDCGHKGLFKKLIRQVGLDGPPTKTQVTEGTPLHGTLMEIAMGLGDYPHSPLQRKAKEKKRHAWLSFISETNDEFVVRANYHTVQELGPPRDFNGHPMVPKDPQAVAELEEQLASDEDKEESDADTTE